MIQRLQQESSFVMRLEQILFSLENLAAVAVAVDLEYLAVVVTSVAVVVDQLVLATEHMEHTAVKASADKNLDYHPRSSRWRIQMLIQ